MSKQSSIDWYRLEFQKLMIRAIRKEISNEEWRLLENKLGEEAKAKHKGQIADAYVECYMNHVGNGESILKEANSYYKNTYGGQND
jgi:hypothetical protein